MPLKQGQSANITCLSSPSKPPSKLILYKNEDIMATELSSSKISIEFDTNTQQNLTKLVYTIDNPESSWHNVIVKCEQIYKVAEKNIQLDVTAKIQVYCK
jgi:hypothetical protein